MYYYYYSKKINLFICMIVLVLFAIFVVFFDNYYSINCVYNECTLYKRTGMFGTKNIDYTFDRRNIERYEIQTSRHRSGRHSSYHTDYQPVLIMKSGEQHRLPFGYCREEYRAEEFALDIMSTRHVKDSTHPFGW